MCRLPRLLSYLCLGALLFGTVGLVHAQSSETNVPHRLSVRSIEPLETSTFHERLSEITGAGSPSGWRALAPHIAQLYRYQAAIVEAEAANNRAAVEATLERAMNELQILIEQPGAIKEPRVRQLYQTIVREYESYYGPSDSLKLARGKIFSFRDTLFAALNQLEAPLLEDVMIPELPPVQTTIPMTVNRLVKQSIDYLLEEPERHLYHWISRSATYFPMIEKILKEEGAPNELKYLAMIESGLNPRARSWASAVGMWQFMRGTARFYDLKVNHWIDERRDPVKSTRTAIHYLQVLYDMFGDWHLAIAAYNCGPGNMQDAIRAYRRHTGNSDPSFWELWEYLPRETRSYVPMYIATALVVSNPDKFGLKEVEPGPPYQYDLVPIEGMIKLETIAELANTDVATIRALNPEIRRWTTPPSEGAYMIRIPLGSYPEFAKGYAKLPDDMKRSVAQYRVKRGDTLSEIASRFGISVYELKRANGIRGHIIQIGQQLMVPVPDYTDDSELMASAQPMSVQYDANRIRPIVLPASLAPETSASAEQPVAEATAAEAPEQEPAEEAEVQEETPEPTPDEPDQEKLVYRVRFGDTLIEIADRYDIYVHNLRDWNDLHGNTIYPGEQLVIYTSAAAAARAERAQNRVIYRVRSGDTLIEIADRYDVYVHDLHEWNDINGSRIRVGQRLTIYSDNANIAKTYRVQHGDSLYVIAQEHGVSVQQLKRWNNLSSNIIQPGQTLRVSG